MATSRNDREIARAEMDLQGPPFPEPLRYLWNAFGRMSGRRGSNGWGPNPIGWADIDAFCRLSGTRLDPWEIEIIEMLDNLSLVSSSKKPPPKRDKPGAP